MTRARSLSDDTVLDRASAVFWQRGFADTSMRELTAATGLGAAALYNRYGDKDGLFLAVLRHYGETRMFERLDRVSATTNDPIAALRAFFDDIIAASLADPARRGCLMVNTLLDGAVNSDAARDDLHRRFAVIEGFFAAQLRAGIAAGALPADTEVAAKAAALIGCLYALRVMARVDPDPARLRHVADHALAFLPPPHPQTGARPT